MLKGLTSTWKNGCNAKTLTFSEYIIIDNKKIPVKAVLKDDCYNNGNFIGTFIFKEISFEVENNIDFKRKEFEYYKVVNGEAIKFGTFITTEITDNDTTELVKVVGMDFGLKTQVEYMSSLDYSSGLITLLDVWNECCELSGLTSGITDFTNSDFIVESDQFTGTGATIRDVFVAIAQSSCSFVKVMNDDKIYLIFNEATQDVVEDYTDLDDKRDTKPITCVRLGMSQIVGENLDLKNDELVKKYGEHWLIINDNPFAYTQKKREELIYAILDKIKGFGYSAFSAKTSFKPYLTCGDIIKFKNKNGELINSILLRYEHNYDEITLEAPSETSATVNYVYPANAIDLYKKAEVKVNKEANNITFLTEQTKTLRENLTNGLNKANSTANDALQKANDGLSNVNVQYYLSTSNTTLSGGTWSDNAPSWVDGKYMWSRTKVTNAKGEVSYEPGINGTCIAGATGATGKDGVNGKSITIKSKAIEYQASTSGTSAPTGTWTTTIPNVNKGSYLWTRTTVTYSDDTNTVSYSVAYRGTDGIDGTNGTNGTNGKDGKGITSITYYYATSTSQTAPSEANITSTTIPTLNATNKYLWQKEVIKFSDNTNKTSILLIAVYGDKGQTGATGKGVKSIVEQYYLSSSNTTQTGGDWSNTQPNWVNGKYIWTRSHITWSDNTTTDTTPILANGLNNANSTATNAISMADSAKKDVQNTNENLMNNYYTISQTNELVQTAEDGLVNAYTTTGGANIFVNTGLWFVNDNNDQNVNPYEDWKGKALRKSNDEASNGNSILLQNGTFEQEQEVPNGNYSISFMYKKLISQSVASVVINGKEYQLNSTTLKEFYTGEKNEKNEYITEPIVVTAGHLKIQFKCNTNGGVEIYDLMANKGSIKLAYSQNQNETTTETVKISKGITITSTNMETIFKANANGIRILSLQNEKIAYFTDKGLSTKELTVENKAQMCSTLISEVGDQTWLTRM